ncbi:hypothetical protein OE810_07775 [Rhodobacteraceae bacterium XHP0102]|nr:hypothetical protein [Rhodobacteraceae bacterium XHP0102]
MATHLSLAQGAGFCSRINATTWVDFLIKRPFNLAQIVATAWQVCGLPLPDDLFGSCPELTYMKADRDESGG